eukprot:4251432-Pyramimonas_sp.AAC.1
MSRGDSSREWEVWYATASGVRAQIFVVATSKLWGDAAATATSPRNLPARHPWQRQDHAHVRAPCSLVGPHLNHG